MASVEHQAAQDMHNPAGAPIAGEAAARDLHDSAVAAAPLPKMQQPQKTASKQQHDSPVRPSSEEQQADQPSARRERKKTEFFQPEAKAEAAKLQIKEANVMHMCTQYLHDNC